MSKNEKVLKVVPGREAPPQPAEPKSNVGRHDAQGRELVDGRPMEPPVGYTPTPSIQELIAQMVGNRELQEEIKRMGHETEEEANDFDVGDDLNPESPWELYYEDVELQAMIDRAKAGQPTHDVIDPPSAEPSNGPGGPSQAAAQPPPSSPPGPAVKS